MWYPPSKQQIESNTNPFRALTIEQMRLKQQQEIAEQEMRKAEEEGKTNLDEKVKVPSTLIKSFQKDIKNERDYQFAGTTSKEDKKQIIDDEKELIKVLKLLQKGQIEQAYDAFDALDTALQDVVPQKLLKFMDKNLSESTIALLDEFMDPNLAETTLALLDEIVRAKDKYPEIDKIKKVMKQKGIGFYTEKGKIMVNPKNEMAAKEALSKAFGGDYEKKTGMQVKGDKKTSLSAETELEEMSAKDHYKKVLKGGRGKGYVVGVAIDRDRYPNREKEGLEGPYKSRKSGKIFYYDKKEGKYYDPDSDMFLAVSDVMESTELGEWWEKQVNSKSKGWKTAAVKMDFGTYNKKGQRKEFKKGDKLFYLGMKLDKYKLVIAATDPKDEGSYFSIHPARLGLKGFDSATGTLKDHVELDEATRHTVHVETDRAGYRKLEKLIASLDGYQESEFEKEGKATFTFDAKKHDGTERKKVAEFIKSVKGVEFSHAIKEDTELTEAWTADSVKKNADIGSDSGYGINIKKRGSITKTPYKHMLMLRTSAKKIKVRFDHGKDEFVGSPEQVADHLNRILGIKENPEYDEDMSIMNIGEALKFPKVKGKFTPKQIDTLRKEYAKIGTVDPSQPTYKKLTAFLDGLDDDQISQLSQAKIKFISGLALNRAVKRGLKDSYEFDSKTGEYIRADGEDPLGIDGSLDRQVKESVEISEAVDEVAARELTLYIENDSTLYRQRVQPIIKNLARKMKKGSFDAELAVKGFMYAVEHGLKNYKKDFGDGFKIDKDTKKKVAQDLLDGFMDEIEDAAK